MRYTPEQLRKMANELDDGNCRDWTVAPMLRQAADDADEAERFRHVREHTKAIENFYGCEYGDIDTTVDAERERQKRKEQAK